MTFSSLAFTAADVQAAVAKELETGAPDRLLRKAAAGLAVHCTAELETRYGRVYGRRVALLVGTGNNGADALLAGIILRRRGVRVAAFLTGDTAYAPGLTKLRAAGGRIIDADTEIDAATCALAAADLVVDGIVGESGAGPLRGRAAQLVTALPNVPVIAVDLPSGTESDTGEIAGLHVQADITVTFGAWKAATFLPPASGACGELRFVDVGLPGIPGEPRVRRLTDRGVAQLWPRPTRISHKYLRGVVGVVAGSDRYPGAAVLACMGAAESGAGIVRFIGPQGTTDHVLNEVPESVPGTGQVQAWLLGSGVDNDPSQDAAIDAALSSGQPCVIDAGALEACVRQRVNGHRRARADQLLLTPHAGELARMLSLIGRPVERAEVEDQPLRHGLELAEAIDATVLVKGATTIVVRPDGYVASQAEAPPWLATAGAGDVLAGIAGALMAGGLGAFDAGEMAAFIHGRAAARAHTDRHGGPITASAVARALPSVIGEILD
ncbi:NAD(P)H-hydrate dehydratase [Nocardia tengchongensis]|uniref:NAD(P)H-hydrate dehydratase n=1 Tax=Nocardia tengchongensis TaxID=2055889 RepID=UPI00366122F5